ncbi:MAG: hypothetical protein II912_06440, partial [Clostridia bacterium]|nr:hypothetical protein [Clostridia bacterium]
VIELKKEANPQKVLAALYKYSDLQVTFGVNMVAVAAGKPVLMGLKTVIGHFIRHQKEVVTRRTQYELDQAKARAHILEGLIIAVDNLDEVIALIRASRNGKEAKQRLMDRFGFTDVQAQAILDLRLQRLTGLEIEALRKEYADILKLIETLESILKSEKKLMQVIKKELREISAQFGDDRRTEIVKEEPEEALPEVEEGPLPEEAVVFLTRGGQLRRVAPRIYEKLDMPEKESDRNRYLFHTQTDHTLYFFTNLGNCYPLSVGALTETSKPRERGGSLTSVLAGLENGEECVSLLLITPGSLNAMGDLLFFTRQGQVKRTGAADYDVKRSKFAAINLKDGDTLLSVAPAEEGADLLMITRKGMCIRFALDDVPEMGRVSAGVKGMKVDEDDQVILACPIAVSDQIVLFTERGYGKRLMSAMFDAQGRAGKGVKCVYFNKSGSTGTYVAAAARINNTRAFTVMQRGGLLTPLSSDDLPCQDLSDKGKPIVMAVLDDVVEDLIL